MLRVAEKSSEASMKEEVAPVPLVKERDELPSVPTEKPVAPHGAPVAADAPAEPVVPMGSPSGENTQAYKMFWSKFKRPSGSMVETPQGGEAASHSGGGASVPPMASTEPLDMHRADEATPAVPQEVPAPAPVDVESSPGEIFVENQLGDPTLYPWGPDMAFLTGETATGPSEPDTAEDKGTKMSLDVEDTLKDSPGTSPLEVVEEHRVEEGAALHEPSVKEKGMTMQHGTPSDGTANPPSTPAAKKQEFAPTHDDVKAALMRKTTLDLMGAPSPAPTTPAPSPVAEVSEAMGVVPNELKAYTSVVMTLAAVPQDVWVPLSRADALAAGLVPSDVWEPPQDDIKVAEKASDTPTTPTASAPATAPTTAMVPAPAKADAGAAMGEDKADDGKALKAAYMRFHRSVHSSLAALNDELLVGRYLCNPLNPCHK